MPESRLSDGVSFTSRGMDSAVPTPLFHPNTLNYRIFWFAWHGFPSLLGQMRSAKHHRALREQGIAAGL